MAHYKQKLHTLMCFMLMKCLFILIINMRFNNRRIIARRIFPLLAFAYEFQYGAPGQSDVLLVAF